MGNNKYIKKIDVKERKVTAFQAAKDNAKEANKAIQSSQNWLLLLGLAELSFLGTLLFKKTSVSKFEVKTLLFTLLASFIAFILASILQYKHLKKIAREYDEVKNKALGFLRKGKKELEEIPEELKLPKQQITTGFWVDVLFIISYGLVIVTTLGIMFILIFKF